MRPPRRHLAECITFACLAIMCLASCERFGEPTARGTPPNIVLISIDSLRADHVGAYGYPKPTSPTIDRLAAEGLVLERAFSTTSWTLPAHTALFTGMDDVTHTVTDDGKRLPASVPVLPEILRDRGYRTLGFFSGPYLDPAFGFARGFDEYVDCTSYAGLANGEAPGLDALHASHRDVTNPILLDRVGAHLAKGLPQPFFLFLHFWDVHYDYIPPERYWRMFDPDYGGTFSGENFERNRAFKRGMDPADFQHVLALYDGEIRYTDETIGALLDELKRRELLENTLVVITADHGDEFLEHGRKGHGHTLFDEVTHIPLIAWLPGRIAPGRDPRLASISDIAPTILALAGIDGALQGNGASLLAPPDPARALLLEVQAPAWGADLVALRSAKEKVIVNQRADRTFVYDLEKDPAEKQPLRVMADSPAPLLDRQTALQTRLAQAKARGAELRGSAPAAVPTIDAATEERLRALGYR